LEKCECQADLLPRSIWSNNETALGPKPVRGSTPPGPAKQHTSEFALVARPKPDPKLKRRVFANPGTSAVQTAADEVADTTIRPRTNFSPILACINSDTVAVTGGKGRISLWSISNGQSIGHHDSAAFGADIEAMVASLRGQRIAYYSDGTLYIDTIELPELN